jgi:sensor histidine kinase YesM
MKGRNIIWILLLFIVGIIPAYVSANSVEYVFDDAFFTGSYIPSLYVHADVHFNR